MLNTVVENPWVRAVGALVLLLLAGALCYVLKPVLISLFLAFLVAYVFDPVVDVFERRRISRVVAIGCIAAIGLVLLLSVPLYVMPQVITQADELMKAPAEEAESETGLARRFDALLEKLPLERFVVAMGWVAPTETDFDARAVLALRVGSYAREQAKALLSAGEARRETLAGVFTSVGRHTVQALSFLGNLVLFVIVAAYLLKDFDAIIEGAKGLTPPRYREKSFSLIGKVDRQIHGFLRGQALVCMCLAVMYGIGLAVCGVPFFVVIAVFGGMASFVPYLGLALTIGPSLLLALLRFGLDWHVIGVVCTFVAAQLIEGGLLTPKIVGDKVGLNPVWVILSILVFSSWLGFIGLLLAVPIAATLKVFVVEAVAYYKRSPVFEVGGESEDASGKGSA